MGARVRGWRACAAAAVSAAHSRRTESQRCLGTFLDKLSDFKYTVHVVLSRPQCPISNNSSPSASLPSTGSLPVELDIDVDRLGRASPRPRRQRGVPTALVAVIKAKQSHIKDGKGYGLILRKHRQTASTSPWSFINLVQSV
ncbi:hypothetical protein BV25DRAFT_1525927 [Artomyces pyxidatus]|uniref:Uncharacterized protein n=1 Tax=Artomyces pyxidatus TaxID=48021 RepID=A0ACB8TDB0_9AGAM|nr:hypothetical protein BV25DRAFT_1525927 [Artomyces pyxidatus]